MKISNSKKQLAKIIHENGGWSGDAGWAVQHANGRVVATAPHDRPEFGVGTRWWNAGWFYAGFDAKLQPNWHQTILSRDEYFHLYPAQVKVVVENKTTCHLTVADKPTIEQLAADYRNAKDYAERKQQEADAAKADAEAKLAELVVAGTALGLVLSVAGVAPKRATFHNSAVGAPKTYAPELSTEVCDGCGKAAGRHFSRMMFCSHEDIENV